MGARLGGQHQAASHFFVEFCIDYLPLTKRAQLRSAKMKPFVKISVVTPSFNQAAFIEEALWSVKNQGYPWVEHLVMDGGSTDETVSILKRYSSQTGWEHLKWVSEPDNGQSDALNKGFRVATGDIIGWLNSDDRYRTGCFQAI